LGLILCRDFLLNHQGSHGEVDGYQGESDAEDASISGLFV
jgi:hypothetical protein